MKVANHREECNLTCRRMGLSKTRKPEIAVRFGISHEEDDIDSITVTIITLVDVESPIPPMRLVEGEQPRISTDHCQIR